eukprot:scaffold7095_cov128-Skeletonema_menzelii.AAC.4
MYYVLLHIVTSPLKNCGTALQQDPKIPLNDGQDTMINDRSVALAVDNVVSRYIGHHCQKQERETTVGSPWSILHHCRCR